MRGVGGLLHLTQCLGMLWGQNIAHGYIPPSPTLAGLIAGLPLHRYYNNNNTSTTSSSDSNVYNEQGVTRQACQTHSTPHSTTHHNYENTTHTTTTTNSTSDDVMGVGRMCTSALLPSRAAEMTLYDASDGVPLFAVTPCDALDVQQALCLLTLRAHRRQAQQQHQHYTSITNSSGSSVCYDDDGGDEEDKYAARDTLAALFTTVQTHRTLLAGAESLQTGVPLRFTQRALSSAMAYMAHALHTLSTTTTTTTTTDMKSSDTGIAASSHVSLVDNDIAMHERAARMLQQDCHTLREELQQKSIGVHSAWPALCLSPTRFSLAYALQAITVALLTPGYSDVLWLPSADAALAALWLMHLLTHPTQQEHNSTSSSSYSCDDVCDGRKKVHKAEGWSAARRFHVLLTGSPSLHVLPALTALQVPLLHIPTPSLVQQQSAQDSRACHADALPTRHVNSAASHRHTTATDTTTTTTGPSAHTQPSLLLLLLYGFTPTAAQTLYTELHKKMQHNDDVTQAVSADCPALPASCHCVTLQPAMPSIVICHTLRVARYAMHTQDDCTAHIVNNDDEDERKVCAAVARWLYRHAFTPCSDTVRTTTTTASEMNTRESVATSGAVTDEDVLQLQLGALPSGHGVSCVSLTTRAHQAYTTDGEEQTKKNEDKSQACSITTTTTTTTSHAPSPLLATVSSSFLRTPLAFIPRSQLRQVLREVVQLYAGGPSVGHISHSLDMECAIGPLRSAAHGEAVRRCLTAAVKGQPAGYEEEEEVVVVRGRKSSDVAMITEQRHEGGRHSTSHMGSAAPSSSSSVSPHTPPETTCSNHSSSSGSTSSLRPESRHAGTSSHTTRTTTMNGRKMCMQPVRWQKVSGGFPLSMTAAGPTALYLAPCLLCTSLSALTVSPPSTQAETASSTSPLCNSSSSGSDGVEVNEADHKEIHALTEAVHRVCHSVARLTAELERDYDGTVPCVLFVCEYEDRNGPCVQRACEQYART